LYIESLEIDDHILVNLEVGLWKIVTVREMTDKERKLYDQVTGR
jgi:uncharacterized DUF497 family protein